ETDDSLRARLQERLQEAPQGGSKADYVRWAKEVSGVTRAWCFPLEGGAGTVTVRFVRDDDATTIIPDAAEIAAVQAHIEEVRPTTSVPTVAAPAAVPLAFTIALTPNTVAVQAAVTAELAELIRSESYPGATLLLSHIRAAISAAAGENNNVLTVPAADVVYTDSQIGTMGTITWA
ncbi:MAG: baseplate J/gp47 family protein, partial [Sulfuricaulis sp.]|nr:baseplate J/gp47 family protein [Sulfuricaulis sp.]